MDRPFQFALAGAAAALLLAPVHAPVYAQMRAPGNAPVMVAAGTPVVRLSPVRFRASDLAATNLGGAGQNVVTGRYPVPGLGFDYTHFAAVNRDLATRALIDPATQQRIAQSLQTNRVPIVPIPVLAVVNNVQVVVVLQPPMVILSEDEFSGPTESGQQRERRRLARELEEAEWAARERLQEARRAPRVEEAAAPALPPREVPELVLIRRDGALLFAVAYVLRGDRIVYVTREGHRQSVPLQQLDLEATREMNESLGTTLHL